MRRSPSQSRLDCPSQSIDRSGVSFIPNLRVRHRVRDRRHHIASTSASAVTPTHLHSRRSGCHCQRMIDSTPPFTRDAPRTHCTMRSARRARATRRSPHQRLGLASVRPVARGVGNRMRSQNQKHRLRVLTHRYKSHDSRLNTACPQCSPVEQPRRRPRGRERHTTATTDVWGRARGSKRPRTRARDASDASRARDATEDGRNPDEKPAHFARERSPARKQPKHRSLGARLDARDERG